MSSKRIVRGAVVARYVTQFVTALGRDRLTCAIWDRLSGAGVQCLGQACYFMCDSGLIRINDASCWRLRAEGAAFDQRVPQVNKFSISK